MGGRWGGPGRREGDEVKHNQNTLSENISTFFKKKVWPASCQSSVGPPWYRWPIVQILVYAGCHGYLLSMVVPSCWPTEVGGMPECKASQSLNKTQHLFMRWHVYECHCLLKHMQTACIHNRHTVHISVCTHIYAHYLFRHICSTYTDTYLCMHYI